MLLSCFYGSGISAGGRDMFRDKSWFPIVGAEVSDLRAQKIESSRETPANSISLWLREILEPPDGEKGKSLITAQFHKYLRPQKPRCRKLTAGTHDADLVCWNKDRIYFSVVGNSLLLLRERNLMEEMSSKETRGRYEVDGLLISDFPLFIQPSGLNANLQNFICPLKWAGLPLTSKFNL